MCHQDRRPGPPPPPPVPGAGFAVEVVLDGLAAPTNVEFAPDGRVFVAEKRGTIQTFDDVDDATPTLTADFSSQVHDFWDFGFLGLEIDPQYPARPYLYALYAHDIHGLWDDSCLYITGSAVAGCRVDGRLVRLELDANGQMVGSEHVLIEDRFCGQFDHSIGDLEFLADGSLIVSAGDGADATSIDIGQHFVGSNSIPRTRAVTPRDRSASRCSPPPPRVEPFDHRMCSRGATRRASTARSCGSTRTPAPPRPATHSPRTPYPTTTPSSPTGCATRSASPCAPAPMRCWLGDVGWATWEELNRIPDPTDAVVENFGWPCFEGVDHQSHYENIGLNLCQGLYGGSIPSSITPPYFSYLHGQAPDASRCGNGTGSSISGLAFNDGEAYPDRFDDALFFADYSRRCVWAMRRGGDGLPSPSSIETVASDTAAVELEVGPGGTIYMVDLFEGVIRRLVFLDGDSPPVAAIAMDVDNGPLPLEVAFDGSDSYDPDGGGVAYHWDLDGDGEFDDSTAVRPEFTYPTAGDVHVGLEVVDGNGDRASTTATVHAGNSRPVVTIVEPSGLWSVGGSIDYLAEAIDAEDGELDGEAFDWTITLLHCSETVPDDCHPHPVEVVDGDDEGTILGPNHEYPAHLVFHVRAVDSDGLSAEAELRLDPAFVDVSFVSTPSGIPVSVGEVTPRHAVHAASDRRQLGDGECPGRGRHRGDSVRLRVVVRRRAASAPAHDRPPGHIRSDILAWVSALSAALWGLAAASSLLLGAVITFRFDVPTRVIGLIMGFGAGTLLSAIAYELIPDVPTSDDMLSIGLSLMAGALVYVVVDWSLDQRGGAARSHVAGPGEGAGLAGAGAFDRVGHVARRDPGITRPRDGLGARR